MSQDNLPAVAERFLRYVQIDTRSDPESASTPSTECQKDLSRLLTDELREMGLDAAMDDYGYVFAHLDASPGVAETTPVVGFVAHVDTSPEEPGGPVKPMVHRSYGGGVVTLPGDSSVTLDPARSPALALHVGHDLITSDGTTLLGSDDKAGVAIIMQLVADLLADPDHPKPPLAICFTVDEEIGRGVDALDLKRFGAQLAYTVDGGPIGAIDTETFNAAEATIMIEGVNVHPGTAKDVMANAGAILMEILSGLPVSEAPETTSGREGYFCPYRFEGKIGGAEARILLRDFTDTGMERRKKLVEELAAAARTRHPRAKIQVRISDTYKNMRSYIEEIEPRAKTFALAAGASLGMELREESVRGGTDGSKLSERGIPTPNIFTGGYDYHSRFEWNTVQNLETSLAYAKALTRYWAENGA